MGILVILQHLGASKIVQIVQYDKILTCPRFYACPRNLQVWNSCDWNWKHFVLDKVK